MHSDMVHVLYYTNMALVHEIYRISIDFYIVDYCIMSSFSNHLEQMQALPLQYIDSHHYLKCCACNHQLQLQRIPISRNALQWRHNGHDSVSNHQPHDCLRNHLFRRRSKKTSKLRVTGLCAVNSPGTGEFPAQMASNAENVSIWWRHHGIW